MCDKRQFIEGKLSIIKIIEKEKQFLQALFTWLPVNNLSKFNLSYPLI